MDWDDLCKSCQTNWEKQLEKWREIKQLATFKTNKYGGILTFKNALKFHFVQNPEKNDYLETINAHERYKTQSFKWKNDDRIDEEIESDGNLYLYQL